MVITISRQVGAGGTVLGKKIADALGYDYYDKKILELASAKTGISEEVFERAEKEHNSFLYSLATANYAGYSASLFNIEMNTSDNLFAIQSNIIKEIAQKGNCVIVGRCANQVLDEEKDVLKVFLHADKDFRVANVAEQNNIILKDAEALVKKLDKKRAAYYNFFTSGTWGDASDFDISINTSKISFSKAADLIINCVK